MIDLSSFGQFLDEEDSQQARASAITAPAVSPDDMSKALTLGKKRNLPAAVVADNLPDYAEQDHLDGVTAASQQSPAAARWFQTPEHAALSKGEPDKIGALSATLSRTGDFIGDAIQNLLPFQFDQRQRLNRIGAHLQSGEAQPVGGAMQEVGDIIGAPFEYLRSQLQHAQGPGVANLFAASAPMVDTSRALSAKGADIADFGRALSEHASQGVRRPTSVGDALRHPGNAFDYFGGIGAESLPMMLASAPFGAEAGPVIGGLTTQAQSFGQYRSEGVDAGAALHAANLQGVFEALGEIIPFHEAFKPGGSFLSRLARTQVAETGSEMATQAAQDESEAETLGRPITLQQRVANIIDAGVSAFGLSLPMAVVGHAQDDRARANAVTTLGSLASSVDGARRVSGIVDQVADMKLGKLAPDALHALAKEAAPDAHVYLAADQARTLFQSDRASADQFVGDLTGNPDALREAEATGGDVVIPMADFVARVATLPNAADIAKHARLHPEHLSRAELENEDALNEHLASIFGDSEATPADPKATNSSEQVTQDVLGMLLASDRYTPADAELQAKLVGRVFGRMAERSGQDAKALYDRYQLRINGQGGMQGKPNLLDPRTDALLTAIRSNTIPEGAQVFGPSLLAALTAKGGVQDQGGELTGRDAAKARIGLVNRNGMPLDSAREFATEAGYLPDGADINDLLAAMDTELHGEPVYSAQRLDVNRESFRNDALALAQGIEDTFAGTDPEAFRALSNQQIHEKLFPPERSLMQRGKEALTQALSLGKRRSKVGADEAARPVSQALEKLAAVGGRVPAAGWVRATRVVGSDGQPFVVHRGSRDGSTSPDDFGRLGAASGNPSASLGVFFTNESGDAARYGRVGDYYLDLRNPKEYGVDDAPDLDDAGEWAQLRRELQAQGHDGVVLDFSEVGGPVQLVVFAPEQVIPATRTLLQPAFHGSPHRFEKFSLQHIGSGEGAQAFGWGLYFTGKREIAEWYRKKLSHGTGSQGAVFVHGERVEDHSPESHAARLLYYNDAREMKALAKSMLKDAKAAEPYAVETAAKVGLSAIDYYTRVTDFMASHKRKDIRVEKGQLYQVDIPDDGDLLDSDTKIASQNDKVQEVARAFLRDEGYLRPGENGPRQLSSAFREAQVALGGIVKGPDGQSLYGMLAKKLGSEQAASQYLNEHGIPGLKFKAGQLTPNTKGISTNYVIWNDNAIGEPTTFYQPDGSGAPRGQLRIGPDRSMSIDLLKGADLSTFLHETGHFFLEVMSDAAESSADVKADLDKVRAWTGNTGEAFTEDQHEQFARGFEAYLREGKAPAPELRSMFARFRAWLTSVYRDMRGLNVTLTPEVTGVFDRMLATDDEIEAAQVRQGMQPLTLAPESRALLSDKQWETYVAALQDATEEARSDVLQKLLKAHQREAQAWWQEQQAKTRDEVESEFEAAPAVRAWRILSGRTTVDGAEVPEHLRGLRLDRAALVAMTSEQWVKEKLHRLGVYRKEGGVHPDTAALALGFDSGDALVKSLAEVRDLQARITSETDRRMHERHPDPLTDGSLPERAMDAVHNVKRVAALESELAIIAKLANQPAPPARLVREYARRKIAGLTLRGIRPNDYLTAERKAARESAKAAAQGDYAEALQHKRAQALNVALYAEARAAQDKAESQIAALKKLASDKARERVGKAGKSYLDALDAVLEGHELRAASGAEVRRRDALRAWADSQQDEMGDTILSQDLLDRIEAERVTNVRDLTVQQLTDLHETATNIAHLARLKNTLLKGKDQREWADAKDDLVTGMRAALDSGKPPPLSASDMSLLERAGQGYGQFMDWMLRPETVVEWLDGGESGPWHDYFWAPMEAGEQARNTLRRSIAEPLTKLLTDLPKAERAALDEVVSVPEIGRSVSRNTILSALLNLGTASSRDKLLRGGMMIDGEVMPFHPAQVAAMLRHLSPAQANLAQQVWDALDTLWPHIQAQQEALSGFAPDKLEATPVNFTASDGTQVSLRGGYYPAAYDPRAGHVGNQQQDSEKLLGSDFTRATTAKGYTKERTQYAAPMLLDYHAVLSRHLNQVITDLAYRQPLRQMLRVLADPTIKGIVGQRLSPSAWSVLDGSVKATIRGTGGMQEPASAFFEKVKAGVIRNTVVAALGLKVGLLVANTVTAPLLATARVKTRFVVDGLAQYYRHPAKMTALVHDLSPFMADRAVHTGQGYDDILAELRGKHGIRHRIAEASLAMHHWINPLVERGIWLGRYLQAQHEGAGIAESVRLADKSIRQTQTQAAPKDLSAVERDPRYRVFNLFIGPMIIANNRLQDAGLRGKLHGAVATPAVALGTWFAMTVANGALFDLLSGRTPDDKDDDGLDWADWSMWLARKAALFPFQTMPFIRNAANLFDGSKSARPDPLTEAMALMVKFGQSVQAHALDAWQGDHDAQVQLTKDTVRAAGVAVGVPSTQAVITGGNLYDAATGAAPVTSPLDARYLVYRRQK